VLWLQAVIEHADAWPFKDPVDAREVPDYYEIIKDPIGNHSLITHALKKISLISHIVF
jgi:hypothetical protein